MQFLLTNFLGLDITSSKYNKTALDFAIPNIFEKKGYKTIFVKKRLAQNGKFP